MFKQSFVVLFSIFCLANATPVEDGSWRIVGGTEADDHEFNFQAIFKINGGFNCAVSLITERSAVTAAHCVPNDASSITIVAGTNWLSGIDGKTYTVERYIIHEQYQSPTIYSNDIAILILREPIELSDAIGFAELDEDEHLEPVDAVISGWGRTGVVSNPAERLQKVSVKTITETSCQSVWGSMVTSSMICTLTRAGEGSCFGDSGGPLTSNGKLIGIVSWGSPCAVGRPDVFTRISSFIEWIKANAV